MHLETQAIICAVRAHGEHGAIVRALTPGEGIQVAPPIRKDLFRKVLQPGHGRGLENGPFEIGRRGWEFGNGPTGLGNGVVAKVREIKPGEGSSELKRRRQRCVHLLGAK